MGKSIRRLLSTIVACAGEAAGPVLRGHLSQRGHPAPIPVTTEGSVFSGDVSANHEFPVGGLRRVVRDE
jgi:hypothetical protein